MQSDYPKRTFVNLLAQMSNPDIIIQCMKEAKNLITSENNTMYKSKVISEMMKTGYVSKCVQLLAYANPVVQFEAVDILSYATVGKLKRTNQIVKLGAIPMLVTLLQTSENRFIVEKALSSLGNIARSGVENRNLVMEADSIPKILALITKDIPNKDLKIIVLVIGILCRYSDKSDKFLEELKPCIPVLIKLIPCQDYEIMLEVCSSLEQILHQKGQDRIQEAIDAGALPKLRSMLHIDDPSIHQAVLRVLRKISCGNEDQNKAIINAHILPHLAVFIKSSNKVIQRITVTTISNICAGLCEQIQCVIDTGLVPLLLHVLATADSDTRDEVVHGIKNFLTHSTTNQKQTLFQNKNFLSLYCNQLLSHNTDAVIDVLAGIQKLFFFASTWNLTDRLALMIEQCGGLEKLLLLLGHRNNDIRVSSRSLIDKYFKEAIFYYS